MAYELLTDKAIIGKLYKALSVDAGADWVGAITNKFQSDVSEETYGWLGQVPVFREWLGGRHAKKLRESSFSIKNKHFESTLEATLTELRRDHSGQLMMRIAEMGRRATTHWASLVSTLILNGAATPCYDDQYFFDTDHEEGDSGIQSNKIEVDISALPVGVHGTATQPSVPEMQLAFAAAATQIVSFKDDQGEPMSEDASQFIVKVPISLMNVAKQAVATPLQVSESQTVLDAFKDDFSIRVVPNVRLSSWTDTFAMFRADGNIKSFIRQEETVPGIKVKGAGSDYEFDNDARQYGIDTWRNAGYGLWQNACQIKLT